MRWFNFKSLMLLLSCTASHQGAKTNKEKGKCRSEFTTRLLAAYQWQLVPLFWHRVTSHSCTFPTDSCQFSWQSSEPQRNTVMKCLMLRVKTHTHLHFSLIGVDVKELFMIELQLSCWGENKPIGYNRHFSENHQCVHHCLQDEKPSK